MQKIFAYIGGTVFTIVLLFGGGFLTGRLTADKQSSKTGSEYSGEISRIVELTRSYLIERTGELRQRESNLTAREARLAERERLIREAEERANTDRTDLTELSSIIAGIIELSTTK